MIEWLTAYITAGEGQIYGYRKLTTWLRREHHLVINKKTVYRILREADLLQGQPLRPTSPRPPRILAANRVVTGPNPRWETDLKYGYSAGEDRFFYLCSVIDVFDRSILAYHIGTQCTAVQTLGALQGAVRARRADWGQTPPVIRTDLFRSRNYADQSMKTVIEPLIGGNQIVMVVRIIPRFVDWMIEVSEPGDERGDVKFGPTTPC